MFLLLHLAQGERRSRLHKTVRERIVTNPWAREEMLVHILLFGIFILFNYWGNI